MVAVVNALRSVLPAVVRSLGVAMVAATLAGCASESGVVLGGGQTAVQLAEERARCLPFVQAHTETTTELAEGACLIAKGYRAPLPLAHGPARIGQLYTSARGEALAMVGDFQACQVEAFNTPMPQVRDEKTSGIFSNVFANLFPRGAFTKALTADEWALRSFAACLTRRGYTVSGVTPTP
ncbi:MAG: hypothetical protein ACREJY_10570 [Candidatus Rokuibacteriota bacterium]